MLKQSMRNWAAIALALAALPGTARAQWTGDETKSARYELKFCTSKGYFDNNGVRTGRIYLNCSKNAVITGDLKRASEWLNAAQQAFAGQSASERPREEARLIEVTGNLAFAQGRFVEARDAWRELYRRQMELEVQAGDFGSFVEFGRLGKLIAIVSDKITAQDVDVSKRLFPATAADLTSLMKDLEADGAASANAALIADLETRARRVLSIDPASTMAYLTLIFVDSKRGDCAAAIRDAQAELAHSRVGGSWVSYRTIARCELDTQQYDAALKAYDAAIAFSPWVAVNRKERDWALEWIEKRDHPKAFDYYAAARDGFNGMGQPDSEERISAAWDNINKAIELSPDFPLAHALRTILSGKNFHLTFAPDAERYRHAAEADALRAYAQNPESIQSALAMGLVFYQKPKAEFPATFPRAMLWFNLVRARDPDNPLGPQFYDLADRARFVLTAEEQRQRDADNAAYAQRMAEAQRIQDQRERDKAGRADTFSNMQAWCDSIGASSMQNMAAVPPACFAFVRH